MVFLWSLLYPFLTPSSTLLYVVGTVAGAGGRVRRCCVTVDNLNKENNKHVTE